MQGLHLTADLSGCTCAPHWLRDAPALVQWCAEAAQRCGLQAVAQLGHRFADTDQGAGGVTATVLLAESHLCVHTWPELGAVTLDVYVCNMGADHSAKAHALMALLCDLFQPAQTQQHQLWRGALSPTPLHAPD